MFTPPCRDVNEPFHIFTHDPMPTCDAHRLRWLTAGGKKWINNYYIFNKGMSKVIGVSGLHNLEMRSMKDTWPASSLQHKND